MNGVVSRFGQLILGFDRNQLPVRDFPYGSSSTSTADLFKATERATVINFVNQAEVICLIKSFKEHWTSKLQPTDSI
jgi:hypothetical protein